MSRKVMAAVLAHREVAPLLSDEHFPVEGTLIEGEPWCATASGTMANALTKRFRPKVEGDLPGDEGPGDEWPGDEWPGGPPGSARRLTPGPGKGHDGAGFDPHLGQACVTPHAARKDRNSATVGRTTRHESHALSLKHRKRTETSFGWGRTVGGPQGSARSTLNSVHRTDFRAPFTPGPSIAAPRAGALALHPDHAREQSRPAAPVAGHPSARRRRRPRPQPDNPAGRPACSTKRKNNLPPR